LVAARKVRQALASLEESRDLIELGAYSPGTNKSLDAAIRMRPEINDFLRQDTSAEFSVPESLTRLQAIAASL
jgi:flagellum-specific ATP synthase